MTLQHLVANAHENGASDLHLEAGMLPTIRVRGALRTFGEPVSAETLFAAAKEIIGHHHWPSFLERRSYDLSKTIRGARCRINILQSSRGIGFAIRLLPAFQATLETLNLHPDLKKLVDHPHGLILISGPTGSGKTSTLAALIQTINLGAEAKHIVTIENPIEYSFRPRRAFIRQREVGRDTPSFEQALLDSLREDPDVLMVGEMREPETMRLTLNAAETGHLVLATVHSSTCAEALQRVVGAFPAEIQNNIAAQLADCLIGVISQRLQYRQNLNILVPECEILFSSHPVKNFIRNRDFFKIQTVLETGAEHGMYTFARYRSWLEKRTNFHIPQNNAEQGEPEQAEPEHTAPPMRSAKLQPADAAPTPPPTTTSTPAAAPASGDRIEIEPVEEFE
ncbi:MAG: type IV pilus twitching motility protein PilT, partial [Limisphaerales bacterium]